MKTERKNEHYLALQQAFDAPWPGPVGELVTLEKGNIHLQIYPHDGSITPMAAAAQSFSVWLFPNGAVGRATGECDAECWWAMLFFTRQ